MIFVKIRRRDVTWRHVTSFSNFKPKKCWRQQKYEQVGHPNIIFLIEFYNTNKMRGQPFLYDMWLKSYRHFRNMSDFWWRHHKIADVSKNNDGMTKFMVLNETSIITL